MVTSDYPLLMRVVNVKELKARLSAYLREARRGETYLVTDRDEVVARLAPPPEAEPAGVRPTDDALRLLALGARLPLRPRRPSDLRRTGPGAGLTTAEIDALLDETRNDTR
jgi:antitoxin (DNA-binding transcriptional repressor) of toxin-antitoxin stability system